MSDDKPPPKRYESDLTIPLPRYELAPPASVKSLMEAAYGPSDYETLERCPACEHCPACLGQHMVLPVRAIEIRRDMDRAEHLADDVDDPTKDPGP
jgi:ferredoxin